jgi:hypothetical protein
MLPNLPQNLKTVVTEPHDLHVRLEQLLCTGYLSRQVNLPYFTSASYSSGLYSAGTGPRSRHTDFTFR